MRRLYHSRLPRPQERKTKQVGLSKSRFCESYEALEGLPKIEESVLLEEDDVYLVTAFVPSCREVMFGRQFVEQEQ